MPPRSFPTTPAVREQVHLILGLVGPSSSGKTWTALELATGMQRVTGGDIEMIDTEHGRGLFYAEHFRFHHTRFDPPYASLDYKAAIEQAAKRSKIIIVDSMSHEHDGEGGMVDYQEHELTRLAGDDDAKRQRVQMLAWAKPKAARRKLITAVQSVDAHLILCFRAKNSSKPGKDAKGRSIVVPMGFVPIAGEEFAFECALSMLFHPNARGVPTWEPEMPGERIAVKVPRQFEWITKQTGPITAQDGQKLAEWAKGGIPARAPQNGRQRAPEPEGEPIQARTPAAYPEQLPPDDDEEIDFHEDRYPDADAPVDFLVDLQQRIDNATDPRELADYLNATMKSDVWKDAKTLEPVRAQALVKRGREAIAKLRDRGAA